MSEERIGDWMQTAGGRKFWPLDPRPDEVHIDDIAHALSHMCRFGGHCRTFYSVAEHSVRVADYVRLDRASVSVELAALLHDAAEAYVVDIPRPLKRSLSGYKAAEVRVMAAIEARFGISTTGGTLVKWADEVLLATEARDLMGGESAGKWCLRAGPLLDRIEPWSPAEARQRFLARFAELAPSRITGLSPSPDPALIRGDSR